MFCELTGESSVASNETERHISERVRQAIELEDTDAVVDLRHDNEGQPNKFWEVCEAYINGNMETAVNDRQHDYLEDLAVAMSVPDLLCEVSKRVEPGTQIPSVQ